MKNYDGWVIKSFYGKTPWLIPSTFRERRLDVIKDFDGRSLGLFKKLRSRGEIKAVKIRLMEVSE